MHGDPLAPPSPPRPQPRRQVERRAPAGIRAEPAQGAGNQVAVGGAAAEVPAVLNQSGVVKIRTARPAHDPPDGPGESTRPPLRAATGKGRRLPSGFLRHGAFRPGDYQIVTAGSDNVLGLWVLPPGGGNPRHVTDRRYIEHHDGTVSIEGTLLFDGWEGSLEHGVWRASSGHALA